MKVFIDESNKLEVVVPVNYSPPKPLPPPPPPASLLLQNKPARFKMKMKF